MVRWQRSRLVGVAVSGALLLAACGSTSEKPATAGGAASPTGTPQAQVPDPNTNVVQALSKVQIPQQLAALAVSDQREVFPAGTGQTMTRDPKSGALYMAWMRNVPGDEPAEGKTPAAQIVVASSTDDGKTFGEPVVVSTQEQKTFYTSTSNPAQGAVGSDGKLYVTYTVTSKSEWTDFGASNSWIVRSEDGGKTFSDPLQMVTDEKEGLESGIGESYMNGLYVAKDGDLFYSFLDEREIFADKKMKKSMAGTDHAAMDMGGDKSDKPDTQLRITRSADGGRTWSKSTLVGRHVCGCCGTVMAENGKGELFAGTRSAFLELAGSYDAVRDLVLAHSSDDGATWSSLTKVHDDGFKISGCPDVAMGLASDSLGHLHAAWYTGTESNPGVFYSRSDDGQTWTKPLALQTGKWSPYADLRLVIDGKDQPWVAFEDRSGDIDKVQVARIDPNSMSVSLSAPVAGRGPALAVGDGWALLSFDSLPANEDDEGPTALNSLLARLPVA